jgi:hypothetical protein
MATDVTSQQSVKLTFYVSFMEIYLEQVLVIGKCQ